MLFLVFGDYFSFKFTPCDMTVFISFPPPISWTTIWYNLLIIFLSSFPVFISIINLSIGAGFICSPTSKLNDWLSSCPPLSLVNQSTSQGFTSAGLLQLENQAQGETYTTSRMSSLIKYKQCNDTNMIRELHLILAHCRISAKWN